MGQAVAGKTAIGTEDNDMIRRQLTDVLADSVAKALVDSIINSVSMD